jgi:ubiquinol-cytochrome c reductase iron-sulfur subunit
MDVTEPNVPSGDETDENRRRFLAISTAVVGGAGVCLSAIPLIQSMEPSTDVLAAGGPVQFNLDTLEPGKLTTLLWRGKPVWVLHRTQEQIDALPSMDPLLKDPNSLEPQQLEAFANGYRSLRPEYLIVVGICTHLGCIPNYEPAPGVANLGEDWKGGFFCPCHGSRYDLAGRVMKGSPAPLNLPVPPYFFQETNIVRIGVLENGTEEYWQPITW